MRFQPAIFTAALAAVGVEARPKNGELSRRASPTIYLAGDSTMAKTASPLMGWGEYLGKYVSVPVVNKAISGRSARSYWNEGRFTEIEKLVAAGDVVVIEFGHNDGGSPNSASDNGRSDCPGTALDTTCKSGKTGETVYTFAYYVEDAARRFVAKGALVVVSSQTPNNMWEGGKYGTGASRFVEYAARAAKDVGRLGATFVDHFQLLLALYLKLGNAKTNALYPKDHTHTSLKALILSPQAFVQAIAGDFNGTTPLKQYVKLPAPSVF